MRFFNLYLQTHTFSHIPGFSRFILENHLELFVTEQVHLSREIDLPLLKQLKQYSDEQLIEISKVSMAEYLTYLSENRAKELTELLLKRWEADELGIVGKFELLAEDITLVNYVRGRTFRKFIPLYTADTATILELADELESFLIGSTTAATNTYIRLLKDRISTNEKELLEAQRLASIGSFEWDLKTNKSKNSPEIYRIFEIEPGVGPDNFLEHIHPDDKLQVAETITRALAEGNYENEYRFVKDGKTKFLYSKGIVVYDSLNKPEKIIGMVQDITKRKQIEQELIEKTIALERSNKSLEQFAYVASHDLKEPLRKICLFTDQVLKKEDNLSPTSRTLLSKVHASTVRMQQMIHDIMDYSTISQWEEKQLVRLDEIIKEAIDFLEQTIEEKQAIIELDPLPQVYVINSQFRQLFQNLISNALKFSKPNVPSRITIQSQWLSRDKVPGRQLAVADKYLQVFVKDNGIGFDQQYAVQIFNLFSRLHSRAEYNGTGLGLAIARRIIEYHGGVIEATSKEGEGATFSFIIPQ